MDESIKKYIDEKFVRGVTGLFIIASIKKKSTYPYALVKSLKGSKMEMFSGITKNDVYNILNSLEKKGYLKSRVVKGFSRAQKLYSITPGGRRVAETEKKLLIRHIDATKKLIEEEFE